MNIAYVILCHRFPEHVLRLIDRLRSNGCFFVIHVDKRANPAVRARLLELTKSANDVFFAESAACYWGGYGIVQGTINGIETAVNCGRDFAYLMLVSGQDYPIMSNADFFQFLREHNGMEFIETFPLNADNRWSLEKGKSQAMARVMKLTLWYRSRPLQLPYPRKFPFHWTPFGGSQWWCLTKECIVYIHNFLGNNPKFRRYFRHTFIPDESMFHTIIGNSPFSYRIYGDDLRYTDWKNPNLGYPRTLNMEDVPRLEASGKLIGRKIEPMESKDLLEWLDRKHC